MAEVSKEILIAAPPARLFDVIVDYPSYPEYVPGIKACRVLPGGERAASSTSWTWVSSGSGTCSVTSRSGPPG